MGPGEFKHSPLLHLRDTHLDSSGGGNVVFEILERIISHSELKSERLDGIVRTRIQITDERLKEQKDRLKEDLRKNLEITELLRRFYVVST